MKIIETPLQGVFEVVTQAYKDDRGLFARSFCADTFREAGLIPDINQCNISVNHKKGTLRGMHFQKSPYEEVKLVRCIKGRALDVVVDLRPNSATYLAHFSVELSEHSMNALYLPEGIAHGFLTLKDNTALYYQMSTNYHPEAASGVRWNDPALALDWPIDDPILSDKDQSYPDIKFTR